MKRLFFSFIICLASAIGARSQEDAQFSQYFMAMGYYNPGYAGTGDELNIFALQRMQWVGMPGAPTTSFINMDMPLKIGKANAGVGGSLFTENIGLFRNSRISGQFAYKRNLFGGTLSIGVQAGLASVAFDGTKADFNESDSDYHNGEDEAIPRTEINGMTLDINAGLYYTHKKFYLGIASAHLLEPEFELEENISTFVRRTYNLTGGYNIQLKNSLFELQPSVFMKTDLQSFQVDVSARIAYNKKFSGGLSWRGYEAVVLLGASFGNVEVGYAYDFPTGPLLKASSGSHELVIKYKVKLDKTRTGNYRHKSVRIL